MASHLFLPFGVDRRYRLHPVLKIGISIFWYAIRNLMKLGDYRSAWDLGSISQEFRV
jgi:hypothetical protein